MKNGTKTFCWIVSTIVIVAASFGSLLLCGSLYAQSQTQWSSLPSIDSVTSPAVTGHEDGKVYIVGIAFSGLVAYTSANAPGGWTEWQIIGPQPSAGPFSFAFYAQPDTAPFIVRSGAVLYLFVRGKDNNLYESHKQGSSAWSDWQQLTSDGRVTGRISVAHMPLDKSFHVIFTSADQTVEYRCYVADSLVWSQRGATTQWNNAVEGTAGTDGSNLVVAVIMQNDQQLIAQSKSSSWDSWTSLGAKSAGSNGNFYEVSDVIYTAGYFHVAYAISYLIDDISMHHAYEIQHWRIRPGQVDTQSIRTVSTYNPVVTDPDGFLVDITHPRISLIAYRNKLVMAYRDPMKLVRYARWDNADPAAPWITGKAIPDATKRTDYRPALGTLNRRPFLSHNDYAANNFGNDLFAAISETGTDSLLFINFSRAIFSREIDSQLAVYNSNSDGQTTVCRNQNDPLAPSLIADIGQDGRPFFTELGYILWTLPNWLIGSNFKRAGTSGLPSREYIREVQSQSNLR